MSEAQSAGLADQSLGFTITERHARGRMVRIGDQALGAGRSCGTRNLVALGGDDDAVSQREAG